MKVSYVLVLVIVCQTVAGIRHCVPNATLNADAVVASRKTAGHTGAIAGRKSAIATRSHSSLQVPSAAGGEHAHANESPIKTSRVSSPSTPHGNILLQFAERIDWKIAKVVLGVVLLLPSMPSMIGWQLSLHAPYPFLLSQNSVPSWPNNLYELVSAMSLLGLDLILLGAVEYDWHLTMYWLRIWLFLQYGVLGFICHFYGIISVNSPYESEKKKVLVPEQNDGGALDEAATAPTAAPLRDTMFSNVMGSVAIVRSSAGQLHQHVKAWVYVPPPLQATTQYQDVGTPLVRLCILTVAQTIMIYFYFNAMEAEGALTPQAYSFWMAAIPVQIVAKTQMGTPFCEEICFWNDILHAEAGSVVQRGDDKDAPTIQLSYSSCLIRAAMSYYANCWNIALIALTLPLFLLSAATGGDFVKDCFAVVFITTLDDLGESVSLLIKPPHPV
jgi:hypothetical protein